MFASAKNLFKPCIFISTRRPSTLCSLFLLIICYVLLLVNPYNRIYIYNGIRLRSKAQYYENTGCLGGEPQTSSQHISSSWKSILTPESLQSYPAYYVNFTIHKNHRLIVPQSALHHTSPLPLLDAGMCIQTNHILNSQPSYRCLPSFFIIGAMKSGTGELLKWLSLHPLLRSAHAPHKREGGFFSRVSHHPSLEAYLSHLPPFSAAQASSLYTFEKSPAYLRNATALRALSTVFPHSRIIVILRKPAERSLSEFLHHSRHRRYRYLPDKGKNTGEVIVNTRYLRNRIIGASNTSTSNNNNSNSIHNSSIHKGVDTWLALSHPPSVSEVVRYFRQGGEREEVGNSRYPRQLRALWDSFPPSQVLVLLQEELLRDTLATLRKIEVFLGLPCFDFSSVAVTSGGIVRRKPSSKEGWIEGIKDYAHSLFNLVGLVELVPIASRRVGGRELLAMTPVSFQREMKDKFKEEVEELKDMLKSLPQQSVALPSTPLEVLDDWI